MSPPDARTRRLADEFVSALELDLAGLTVYTEAASGSYLYTPLLAALAGAERVRAVTRDSHYAKATDVVRRTAAVAREWGVAERLEISPDPPDSWLADSDIVTNSGFVRPITADKVALMKPTAVIPLMWETWEFRASDLDLAACRERDILVLGTCESRPPCDMTPYSGFLGLKLLFELGLEGHGTSVAVLGDQPTLGAEIARVLRLVGVSVSWFGDDAADRPYAQLDAALAAEASRLDAVLLAEHVVRDELLDPRALAQLNPALRVGVIAGNIDGEALAASGLCHFPAEIMPVGHMSYQPSELGPRPVLHLYAAGLKVGQEMARARRGGATVEEAARVALANSPAMDFGGELAWT